MISKFNRIRWDEVLNDYFSRSLNPLMLLEKGLSFTKMSRTKGTFDRVAYEITYDREYVLAFITSKILKALQIKDKEDAIALIVEAWNYYEKSWKEKESHEQ